MWAMQPVVQQLQELLHLQLKDGWIQTALAQGARSRDDLLSRFLWSDMIESSDGSLPHNWEAQPQLRGRFVLQLNEVVNIAAPARDRYKDQQTEGGKRCLKLALTDGKCSAWAMELHKCGALNASLTAGCKVLLTDPVVHGGLLMLMGASVRVLGGGVDRLESARKRLLEHWNQPLGCSLLSVQARRSAEQMMHESAMAAWPHLQPQQQQPMAHQGPAVPMNHQPNPNPAQHGQQLAPAHPNRAPIAFQQPQEVQNVHLAGANGSAVLQSSQVVPGGAQARGAVPQCATLHSTQNNAAGNHIPSSNLTARIADRQAAPLPGSMNSAATAFSHPPRMQPKQPVAAHPSGASSVHPAAPQAQFQPTAMHAGNGVVPRAASTGGVAQGGKVVDLMDSDDEDEEALLASMPLPAAGSLQGRVSVPPDSHMHEDGDDWATGQDAGMAGDDAMAWAPEDDTMDAAFLSDDEVGAKTAQPGHVHGNMCNSGQLGLENCNRAGNEGGAHRVHSIKELVTEFAKRSGTGQYLLHATFHSGGPELYERLEDGSQAPHVHFKVVGEVKDSSGKLSPSVVSHDFLVQSGCGANPGVLMDEMRGFQEQGLEEETAPMISRFQELLNVMEDGCLFLVERCTTSAQWIISIADPPGPR